MKSNKEKIIFIIGILIIFISLTFYAIGISVVSIASVLYKYYDASSIENSYIMYLNKTYNYTIALSLSIFSTFEILYLISYLYKKKKLLLITSIINIIVGLLIIFNTFNIYMPLNGIIFITPLINASIYYILEFKKKTTKK